MSWIMDGPSQFLIEIVDHCSRVPWAYNPTTAGPVTKNFGPPVFCSPPPPPSPYITISEIRTPMHDINFYQRFRRVRVWVLGIKLMVSRVSRVCMAGLVFRVCMGCPNISGVQISCDRLVTAGDTSWLWKGHDPTKATATFPPTMIMSTPLQGQVYTLFTDGFGYR